MELTEEGTELSNSELDQIGPIDYLVVGFPAGESTFTGEALGEIANLVNAGIIRVIDITIFAKNADGEVEALEMAAGGEVAALVALETEVADLLAAEILVNISAAMGPGDVAGVLVYENLWAAPFGSAARRAGGQLIADGRIHSQAIIAAVARQAALEE